MKTNDIIKISIKSLRRNRKKNKLLYIPLIIMLVILFIVDIIQYSTNNYINKIGKGIELRKISGIEYIPSKYEETKNEIEKINRSLETEGGRGRGLVKSPPYGALYQNLGDDNNKSAFVTRFILPFIIISLSLLIPILSIMFSRM